MIIVHIRTHSDIFLRVQFLKRKCRNKAGNDITERGPLQTFMIVLCFLKYCIIYDK